MARVGTVLHRRAIDCLGETGAAGGKEPHVQRVSWHVPVTNSRSSNKNHGGSVERYLNEAVGIHLLSIFFGKGAWGGEGRGGGVGGAGGKVAYACQER
ncbi:unnamed protein product [Ectocarpus sp. 8 AP-2014]